jgi:hypothetical protein
LHIVLGLPIFPAAIAAKIVGIAEIVLESDERLRLHLNRFGATRVLASLHHRPRQSVQSWLKPPRNAAAAMPVTSLEHQFTILARAATFRSG